MKVMMGAQSCGFGPVSKLTAISRLISEHERIFVGDTVAAIYARRNVDAFDRLYDIGTAETATLMSLIENSDCVVSVMDADLVLHAYAVNRPVVMVDSLFRFWQHTRSIGEIADLCATAPRKTVGEVFAHFAGLRPHERILAAHMLSTHSIVQNFPGVAQRIEEFERFGAGGIRLTGSIVDLEGLAGAQRSGGSGRDLVLNIGGFKNFMLDFDINNDYLALFRRWVPDLLADWPAFKEVAVYGGAFSEGREDRIDFKGRTATFSMVPQREFLAEVGTAEHFMLTPGLTSIHESIALERLPMALPEQHYGHVYNLQKLAGTEFNRLGTRLSEAVPGHAIPEDDFTGTAAIVEIARQIVADETAYKRFRAHVNTKIEAFLGLSAAQRADGVAELQAALGGRSIRDVVASIFGNGSGPTPADAWAGRQA